VAAACDRGETTRKDAAGCVLYAAARATQLALDAIQPLGGGVTRSCVAREKTILDRDPLLLIRAAGVDSSKI
jgi:hypothetical protein